MIDQNGYRASVGVIIINDDEQVFWARRIGQRSWQFPQGGMNEGETPEQAMYRELYEEIGLQPEDIEIVAESKEWLRYDIPKHLLRHHSKPLCVGQKQKWFLLKIVTDPEKVHFDTTDTPEFDGWCWVDYWYPLKKVIEFKRDVYKKALQEFKGYVFKSLD